MSNITIFVKVLIEVVKKMKLWMFSYKYLFKKYIVLPLRYVLIKTLALVNLTFCKFSIKYVFLRFLKSFVNVSFVCGVYNKTIVLKVSNNYLLIDKEYDLKINSNDSTQRTVQTILKQKYPQFVCKSLYHEFYFVHRLDYATSGVMCIPLNKMACKTVSNAFESRNISKYYIALVRGFISNTILDINDAIGNDESAKHIQKMCTVNSKFCTSPRKCRTLILVLEYGLYENYPATKILIKPLTGRRHQIRVHCSSLGHTIVGDYTYSNRKDVKPERMFLHALRLIVPNSLENIDISTHDPFIETKVPLWKSTKFVNDLKEDGFKILDCLLK